MTELTARVCQLHDTEANWIKNANDKVLNAGEIVVYDAETSSDQLPEGRTELINYPRIKIGDGTTKLVDLPFIQNKVTTDDIEQGENTLIYNCGGAIDLDDPFNSLNFMSSPNSIEELEGSHVFKYHSSLRDAVRYVDHMNGFTDWDPSDPYTPPESDPNKSNAIAATYKYNNVYHVVLLKDDACRVGPYTTMVINLGGKTLSQVTGESMVINVSSGANIVIDGRLPGSKIKHSGKVVRLIQIKRGGKCCIYNGSYELEVTEDPEKVIYAIYSIGSLTLRDVDVFVHSKIKTSKIVGVHVQDGYTEAINCKIRAFSNYNINSEEEDSPYLGYSIGVSTNSLGETVLRNCNVTGTHSGVFANNPTTIFGGTYESYGHGGLYVGAPNNVAYIYDATFRDCPIPDGYTSGINPNAAAMYIGGSNNVNNIKVFADNCTFIGAKMPIVLRSTSNEHDNSLYISNSTTIMPVVEGVDPINHIRVDDNQRLFIGSGNSFTQKDVWLRSTTSSLVETNYCYRYTR